MQCYAMANFEKLYSKLCGLLQENGQVGSISENFSKRLNDEERIGFCLDQQNISEVFYLELCFSGKDSIERITKLRNKGNDYFKHRQYNQAATTYTEAVLTCPLDNQQCEEAISILFANRSAALFYLSQYKECLVDIGLANHFGYPQKLVHKLRERSAKCLEKIQCDREDKKQFQDVLDAPSSHCAEVKECLMNESNATISSENIDIGHATKKLNDLQLTAGNVVPGFTKGPSGIYPGASEAFSIVTTAEAGRHPIANRDIKVGEAVIIEKPFASVLLEPHFNTHCEYCYKRTDNPVPCLQCSKVRYCSLSCQKEAWNKYHKTECTILSLLLNSEVGKFGQLAVRVITVSGLKKLMEYRQSLDQTEESDQPLGFGTDGVYRSDSYSTIYHLVTNSSQRSVANLFKRSVMAVFLLKCLELTDFFEGQPKEKLVVGAMILRHLQSLPCNAHEVSELVHNRSNLAASQSIEVGAAIYATMSLLNHSCDPSVVRHFYGDTCVVRAMRCIPKGSEIADNYGVLCALTVSKERQDKLQPQYYFTCKCEACLEDWPQYNVLSTLKTKLKCHYCSTQLSIDLDKAGQQQDGIVCRKCNQHVNTQELLKVKNEYNNQVNCFLDACNYEAAMPVFESYLTALDKHYVCRPCIEYNNCQEMLKQCYSLMANCSLSN